MSMTAPVLTPPLRDGESLTREEFMRRGEAMPDLFWAELVDGIVYIPSAIPIIHGEYLASMSIWLALPITRN